MLPARGAVASPAHQPAAFRVFVDRVKPDGVCIERSPDEFARGDLYEFTFEQQEIVVPYARERRIDLHPIDWPPAIDDLRLSIDVDPSQLPIVRPRQGFQAFETHPADQRRRLSTAPGLVPYCGRPRSLHQRRDPSRRDQPVTRGASGWSQ